VDELFIALIAYQRLYLMVDASTRARFRDAGCLPFEYSARGRTLAAMPRKPDGHGHAC